MVRDASTNRVGRSSPDLERTRLRSTCPLRRIPFVVMTQRVRRRAMSDWRRVCIWVAVGAVAACGLVACGGGGPRAGSAGTSFADCPVGAATMHAATSGGGSWPYPNGTLANTRDVPGSGVDSGNVSTLRERWTFTLRGAAAADVGDTGSLISNPVVRDGVVYFQDLHSNVYAVALSTGKLLWECRVDQAVISGRGAHGGGLAGGRVYAQTPTTAFALNATTGREIWANRSLVGSGWGTFGMQPVAADGRDYLATQLGNVPGG